MEVYPVSRCAPYFLHRMSTVPWKYGLTLRTSCRVCGFVCKSYFSSVQCYPLGRKKDQLTFILTSKCSDKLFFNTASVRFMTSVSKCQRTSDKEDKVTQDETKSQPRDDDGMLHKDKELRSILDEIMRDFSVDKNTIKIDNKKPNNSVNTQKHNFSNHPQRRFHTGARRVQKPDEETSQSKNLSNDNEKCFQTEENKDYVPWSIRDRFKPYDEREAEIILDTEELQSREIDGDSQEEFYLYQEKPQEFQGLSLERGKTGVFDLEELVDILRQEKLKHIVAIKVPVEMCYCSYLVIGTALSKRHSMAITEFLLKLYKQKKHKKDPFITIEGEDVMDWKALDMGNIVLHVFLQETREYYDLESLWTIGPEYDELIHKKSDQYEDILEQQMLILREMHPAGKLS